jgi:hypothetical protein
MQSRPFDPSFQAPVLPESLPTSTSPRLTSGKWAAWFDALLTQLAGSNEPRIRQVAGRDGQPQWQVYDPVTGDRQRFSDEQSVRIWLDQRYND